MIREIQAKSALHFHDNTFATNWDVNIYRGCGHGCTYCFARYSHRYLEDADFFRDIYVKTNIAGQLDREMSKRGWTHEPVNVGGVTDAYQPAEEQYCLMPDVIRTFIRHRNPLTIVTKSVLPLRDLELIRELAAVAPVSVIISVSILDESIRKKTEPDSAPTAQRLAMLPAFRDIGCRTGVLVMPIIPFLTDSPENLRGIFERARSARVNFVETGTLHLRGSTREPFMKMLRTEFPAVYPDISRLYTGANADESYKSTLRPLIRSLQAEFGPWEAYVAPAREHRGGSEEQLRLF
jgi:DNA repair photolyase